MSQNPCLGSFGTSISQKMKKLASLKSPSSTLLSLVLQIALLLSKPGSHAHLSVKTQSRTQPRTGTNHRTVKGAPAPNRLGSWAHGAWDRALWQTVVSSLYNFRAPELGSYEKPWQYIVKTPRKYYNLRAQHNGINFGSIYIHPRAYVI